MGGSFFTVWTSEKFFKILLLWNRLSDFEIILQDCYLGDPFQKVFAKFWSIEKYGCLGGGGEGGDFLHYMDMKKIFKNLFLRNCRSEFGIIHKIAPWVTLLKTCMWNFDPSKNMAANWGGDTDMKKFLKNLLLWNSWSDFEIISKECSLGDPV